MDIADYFAVAPRGSTVSGRQDEPQLTSRVGLALLIRQHLGGILALLMHDLCAQRTQSWWSSFLQTTHEHAAWAVAVQVRTHNTTTTEARRGRIKASPPWRSVASP